MEKKVKNKIVIQGKDLINELGLENLSVETQAELIDRMSDVVYKRVLLQVMDKLSEKDVAELNEFFDGKGDKNPEEIIRDKVPDFASLLKEEIDKFGEEMIKKVKERVG